MDIEMDIGQFARWYLSQNCPHDPALTELGVFVTDVSTSTLVYRRDLFLVEYYLMHPNAVVVEHGHPFENLAMHWSGEMRGGRNGVESKRALTSADRGRFSWPPLGPTDTHFFKVGPRGAIFYNISRWNTQDEMDSATRKYIGQPLGEIHARSMQKS